MGIFIAIVAGSATIAYMAVFFSPEARQERAMADLLERYANDTYGGETPEETLSLFIKALETGDVELASKYFVVEKQEEMKEELTKSINEGGAEMLINFYTYQNIRKSFYDYMNTYEYTFLDKEGGPGFRFELMLNTKVNKWKISEL